MIVYKRPFNNIGLLLAVLICVLMLLWGFIVGWQLLPMAQWDKPVVNEDSFNPAALLFEEVLPIASFSEATDESLEENWLSWIVKEAISLDWDEPTSFVTAQAFYLASAKPVTAEPDIPLPAEETPNEGEETKITPVPVEDDEPFVEAGSEPLVCIYNTHNAECYIPDYGTSREEGENGGVYEVALKLAECLQELGINTVQSSTIHDYPDWSLSYSNSLKTMQKMAEEYPSIKVWIDVHRDANIGEKNSITEIDGESVARVMLVVGSNTRLSHPNWQENQAFAQKIVADLDKYYAGLSRGLKVQSGRYNQHFSTHAILVEIGSDINSLDEAKLAVEMLAKSLARVIKKEIVEADS